MLKVYVCTDHDGHYTVGACSIVFANSEHEARGLLQAELHDRGLDCKQFTLRRFNADKPKAFIIINDGDF